MIDVPHISCKDCKFFNRGYQENHCKRVDIQKFNFSKPWFSCIAGEWHTICRDFEPYLKDFEGWPGFDTYYPEYKKVWRPDEQRVPFELINEPHTWYYVPIELFLSGTMLKDGILLADQKKFYSRTRKGCGYQLNTEQIDGVKL